ncbi:hypothetical protein [Mesobacillus selenatarsenatis]|uniref:hypothetical protein n=1 Tax=Mesobacillus selenatarsenatis TaxID=388741 RepID=UPI0012EB5B88|nr:hypothetical protein [Mesobacillus selenatarsenatis]
MHKEFLVQSHRPSDMNRMMTRSVITPYTKYKKAFSGPLSSKSSSGYFEPFSLKMNEK